MSFSNLVWMVFLVGLGVASRLMPHAANATAVAAIGLLAAHQFRSKWHAIVVSLATMLLSDILLWTTMGVPMGSLKMRVVVYGCLALTAWLGTTIPSRKKPVARWGMIFGNSLASATVFFLATNFVWLYSTKMYSHDLNGLVQCYVNALPFFTNMAIGNVVYATALFGLVDAMAIATEWKSRSAERTIAA